MKKGVPIRLGTPFSLSYTSILFVNSVAYPLPFFTIHSSKHASLGFGIEAIAVWR